MQQLNTDSTLGKLKSIMDLREKLRGESHEQQICATDSARNVQTTKFERSSDQCRHRRRRRRPSTVNDDDDDEDDDLMTLLGPPLLRSRRAVRPLPPPPRYQPARE